MLNLNKPQTLGEIRQRLLELTEDNPHELPHIGRDDLGNTVYKSRGKENTIWGPQESTLLVSDRGRALLRTNHRLLRMIADVELSGTDISEGMEVKCDAFFTKLPGLTLTLKPADCTSAIIFCEISEDEIVFGIIHTGRRGVSLELAKKAIDFLVEKYGCEREKIRIGIVPHLFKENRKFEHIDGVENKQVWDGFIEKKDDFYYLDETECVIQQYIDAGIEDKNIQVYNIDTYEAAKKGKAFSYKYRYTMNLRGTEVEDGRFIIAARL